MKRELWSSMLAICECFAKKSVCHMISTSLELSAFKLPIQKFNSMEASMESFSSPHSPLLVMSQISLTVRSMRKIFGQCFSFLFLIFWWFFKVSLNYSSRYHFQNPKSEFRKLFPSLFLIDISLEQRVDVESNPKKIILCFRQF